VNHVLNDSLIHLLDIIIDYWVVESSDSYFMRHPIGNIFNTMFKVIFDRFIWDDKP
jgi:hypothetical protein